MKNEDWKDRCHSWIVGAMISGYGICNTGSWLGVMYLEPSAVNDVPPSWVFVPNDMEPELAYDSLYDAFEHLHTCDKPKLSGGKK